MKKIVLGFCTVGLLLVMAGAALANDDCVMCHQDQKENVIPAHSDCMACHAEGSDEHIANFREAPAPVTNETCETCHQPNEEFLAISAHTMDMECSSCHQIHEE